MPQLNEKLPTTLLKVTTRVRTMVLRDSPVDLAAVRASTGGAGCKLVARVGGDHRLPMIGHELLAFRAERHVLARLLGEPPAVVGMKDRLADHAPDHPGPEV